MNDFIRECDENLKAMYAKDREAKEKGILVGRIIRERFADGYACYEIVKENKTTVRIRVVTGIGDDWRIPYWGSETSIPKSYVLKVFKWNDMVDKIFKETK